MFRVVLVSFFTLIANLALISPLTSYAQQMRLMEPGSQFSTAMSDALEKDSQSTPSKTRKQK